MKRDALKNFPANVRCIIGAPVINNDGFVNVFAVLLQNCPEEAAALVFDDHRQRELGPLCCRG
ncbi:hypothetical protein D3C81_2111010 [compost metagenome]